MKSELKAKQISAFFIALLPLTKIISAPAYFAKNCAEKIWQPLVLLLLFDLLLLLVWHFIHKKHPEENFYEILEKNLGLFTAKTIFLLYALFFLIKSIIPLFEQKLFIENTFYETLPQAPVFYPAFIIVFYLALKGFKSFFRTCEIMAFVTAIGLFLILFLSLPTASFKNLLPLFAFSNKSAPICALTSICWFNDAIYLIFFLGHFKAKKGDELKICLSYFLTFLFVILFFITFYGIFSYVAQTRKVAISELGLFSVALINVGRFDYVGLFMLSLSSIISVSLPIMLSVHCLCFVFGFKKRLTYTIILVTLLFFITIFFSAKQLLIFQFITTYLTPLFLLCGYILPLLGLGGKRDELQKS